jgi:hypothetical protein
MTLNMEQVSQKAGSEENSAPKSVVTLFSFQASRAKGGD